MTTSLRTLAVTSTVVLWLALPARADDKCDKLFDEQQARLDAFEKQLAGPDITAACEKFAAGLAEAAEFEKKYGFLCFSYFKRGQELIRQRKRIVARCSGEVEPAPPEPAPADADGNAPTGGAPDAAPAPQPASPDAAAPAKAPSGVTPAAETPAAGAEDAPPAGSTVSRTPRQREPGLAFGVGFRLSVAGAWDLEEKRRTWDSWSDEWSSGKSKSSGEQGANPGFVLFVEYLTQSRYVAVGLSFGCNFISAGHSFQKLDIAAELQFDPRLRIYLLDDGWLLPYLQLAAGFSLGVTTDSGESISDGVEKALAGNLSGSLGLLITPEGSWVSFYFELGMEGVLFKASSKDSRRAEADDSLLFKTENEYQGSGRHLVLSAGLIF